MSDPFANRMRTPTDPAVRVFPVIPNDQIDLPEATTALNVATPGTVHVTTVDGSEGLINIQPGQSFPIRVKRIWLTDTTATGIVGLV